MTADDARKLTDDSPSGPDQDTEVVVQNRTTLITRAAKAGRRACREVELEMPPKALPLAARKAAGERLKAEGYTVKTAADGTPAEVSWQ